MHGELVPIAVVFIVIGIPIICVTLLGLARIMRGDREGKKGRPGVKADEARMLQEMQRLLSRMEDRIESLETIVLERDRHTKIPPQP